MVNAPLVAAVHGLIKIRTKNPGVSTGAVRVRLRRIGGSLARSVFAPVYSMTGRVSNWWYGGGEDSVHSSVVAPSPQGLSGALGPASSE